MIDINGARIVWQESGPADAPAVIFSCALATDRRLWRDQVESLADRYRVVVYDHRGHGDSLLTNESADWSISKLADDVVGMMDALGLEKAAFAGLSLGGSVGLGLALTRPERISGLACCCARADAPEQYKALWRSRTQKVSAGGMASIAEETMSRWFADGGTSSQSPQQALAMSMLLSTSRQGYIGCAKALSGLDFLDRLASMGVATHYLCGENDRAISPEVVQDMHERTPGSRFSVLSGAGHLANLDRPVEFNAWLHEWLDSLA